ncbi:uncharacterized protein LOC125663356 [Ostrea edulis]|uniref:uncharacterized protein LOC125663356 n=1 Tax=Ostrea edulis TaxID=37623 RepID=UPI0024AF9520|nr:uncharacterized protein LOC125663356 [Ostrea edulis]
MRRMKDIDEQLDSRKNDLMKTDCTIVIAGETSAGKSSVVHLIIGKNILPTNITATTSRLCRMRYSDKMQILTCDSEDRHIEVTECDDREDVADKLSGIARTKDDTIKYVDVWLPFGILKGNVVIVDTPGIGDKEEFANMLMDYIHNALAFVFLVNMGNAGGIQGGRVYQYTLRNKTEENVKTFEKLTKELQDTERKRQEINVDEIFQRDVMEKIIEKFINIHESLHRVTDKMRGFITPFDVEKKFTSALVSFLAPSGMIIAGSILLTQLSVSRNAAIAVAVTGLVSGVVFSGLVGLGVLDDVDSAIEKFFKASVNELTIDKIKQSLTKTYSEGLKNMIRSFLEGDLKNEIDQMKRTVA